MRRALLVILMMTTMVSWAECASWVSELSGTGRSDVCEVWMPAGATVSVGVHSTDVCEPRLPDGVTGEVLVVWKEQRDIGGRDVVIPYYLAPSKLLDPTGDFALILTADKPGTYTVPIKCQQNECTVYLRVTPAVPESDMAVGFYTDYTRFSYPEQEKAYYQHMADHGCTTMTAYGYEADGRDLARELDLAVETGLARFPLFALAGPRAVELARKYAKHYDKWPTLVGYNCDEPSRNLDKQVQESAADWHIKGFKTGTAIGPSVWLLGRHLDVWCIGVASNNIFLEELAEKQKAEVWNYNHGLRGTNAALNRYQTGLYCFATRPKALLLWAYMNDKNSMVRPDGKWNALRVNEHALGTPDGPLSTVGLEGFRDGTIDYRILRTLEETILADPKHPTAPAAAAWLQELVERVEWRFWPGGVEPYGYYWDVPDTAVPPVDFTAMRKQACLYLQEMGK